MTPNIFETRTEVVNDDNGLRVVRGQLTGDIRDDAIARQNEGLHGINGYKHLARVPKVVVEHYCNVNGITLGEFIKNPEHTKRFLNDPAFSDLRIWPGKV